ncbi:hypothetical protein ACSV9I_20025 [Rhizobium sp. G187]|uniref:hypothetical protein n=1 Tax=Rhizobium sp. G187 TaxID=3451352 RepID=UPI003EE71517
MVRLLFRVLSFSALCVGVVAATVDSIASVSASRVLLTPLEAAWSDVAPQSLPALQALVEMRVGPAAWTAFQNSILPQPAFVIFLGLSLALWMIGYKRPQPAGRFAA